MEGTFFDAHDELYHHAKFGEDRTTQDGCRCENVVFFYRQDAAKAGIAKNQVICPAGVTRCTDSRQTWQRRRARRSAWLRKISPASPQGGGNALDQKK